MYIDKAAIMAKIDTMYKEYIKRGEKTDATEEVKAKYYRAGVLSSLNEMRQFINTLGVLEEEIFKECPYRIVGCIQFSGTVLECKGACTWLLIMQKYKGLEVKKGE